MNEAIVDSAQSELNMTMFVAVYHLEDRTLHYSNAGHHAGWIVRMGDEPKIEVLKSIGPRLGDQGVFHSPKDGATILGEKDVLFLYTDGILDCLNLAQETYGKNRLKEFLVQNFKKTEALQTIKEDLVKEVHHFIQNEPLRDDITFAFFKTEKLVQKDPI